MPREIAVIARKYWKYSRRQVSEYYRYSG